MVASNLIAGHPKAGFCFGSLVILDMVYRLLAVPRRLFCFGSFGDFRCDVPLSIVILVLYINIKIGKNRC